MHCAAVIERFGMRADDCELHFYSINFDAASERLLARCCGARVVLRAQGQWGAEEICELIRAEGVSILGFTRATAASSPSGWRARAGSCRCACASPAAKR